MDPSGKEAVIVGRSNLVGRPLYSLLLGANATVTVCHSRTARPGRGLPPRRDPGRRRRPAEAGHRPRWSGPGATVIDVGTNRTDDGLVGDVDFEAARRSPARSPRCPAGVGPMTIAMLLANTVQAARA